VCDGDGRWALASDEKRYAHLHATLRRGAAAISSAQGGRSHHFVEGAGEVPFPGSAAPFVKHGNVDLAGVQRRWQHVHLHPARTVLRGSSAEGVGRFHGKDDGINCSCRSPFVWKRNPSTDDKQRLITEFGESFVEISIV
tara:strand:- start:891 stop:1310 length:420 start_codon:yes stop_codon:yes gene_type:complete